VRHSYDKAAVSPNCNRSGIAGTVLAGGENRRFPDLKAFIKLEGGTIIERNIALLRGVFEKVLISTNIPEAYFSLGEVMVGDILLSRGPMSGIYSSLTASGFAAVFVIACDMPFVKSSVISMVLDKHLEALASGPVDATIPVFNGKVQPLLGIYCRTALPVMEYCILNEKTSMSGFLDEVRTNLVPEADIKEVDLEGRSFVNINTKADYEEFMLNRKE